MIVIRRYEVGDSIAEITHLLHKSYKFLADLGLRYLATHQSDDVTMERINKGVAFVALDNELIVGTITVYEHGDCNHYRQEGVWHFGQFGVDPLYQGKGIGNMLMKKAEQFAVDQGATHLALDTAIPATHLVELYSKKGFVVVEEVQWPEANYKSYIMSKKI